MDQRAAEIDHVVGYSRKITVFLSVSLGNTLIEKGVLREEGGFFITTSDYSFTSAYAAVATVICASADGRILWKLPDGRTCAD